MEQKNQNTALMVMDMQETIVKMLPDASAILNNVSKAIKHARENNIPIIYVVVGFREGTPEINVNNKGFSASKARFSGMKMEDMLRIESSVAPLQGDITVVKRRVSAFTGSDLEVILRAQGIQHMILTGIATSGVVLSTLREAADKDYRLTVISDCCADGDEEVHRVLTTKVFPRQADVISLEDWIK